MIYNHWWFRSSAVTFVRTPASWHGRKLPGADIKERRRGRSSRCRDYPTLQADSLLNAAESNNTMKTRRIHNDLLSALLSALVYVHY